MCLLLTACAAAITTIVWYFKAHDKGIKLGALALMYWGATLMWLVDAFYCVAGGEPFLDISVDDAMLGLVIVISGIVAWVVMLLCSDPKRVFASLKHSKA